VKRVRYGLGLEKFTPYSSYRPTCGILFAAQWARSAFAACTVAITMAWESLSLNPQGREVEGPP
jgi:hypothetical protein